MALDATQTLKIQAWIKAHPFKPCPMCTTNKWTVADPVGQAFIYGTNTGKALPSVPFICSGCGLTFLVNAANIGLP
jgi:hypothetical protein